MKGEISGLVLGIMSGTSLDGVDFALCDFSATVRLRALRRAAFPRILREQLRAAATDRLSSYAVGQLHHDLGRFYAAAARRLFPRRSFALIGLHGQTIYHQSCRPRAATFQMGEPAYLARAFRVPVISNFRVADIAAGGEGAPLATAFHVRVFGQFPRHVCVNNLGGISNVTSISWRRKAPVVRAFDTGPANVLLDLAAHHFSRGRQSCDREGRQARAGRAHQPLVDRWLRESFFRRTPPKSTGREHFGDRYWEERLADCTRARLGRTDVFATLTEFTAQSIALNYRLHLAQPHPPDRVILTGGGAANPALRTALRRHLEAWHPRIEVTTSDRLGWPLAAVEPAAFALLAHYRWHRLTAHYPETTGATETVLLGQVTEVV